MKGTCLCGAIEVTTIDRREIDSKPSYYDFANRTTNLTEAEVIARFSSSST